MTHYHWKAIAGLAVFAGLMAAMDVALAAGQSAPAVPPAPITLAPFASGFQEPLDIKFTPMPTDTRMFVAERAGVIRIVEPNGTVLPTPFLDISPTVDSEDFDEMGLQSFVFDPNYASNGNFYVFYTRPGTATGNVLALSRFHVSANPNVAELAETTVLTINHPDKRNHNGAQLAFGADGDLYISVGDGGPEGDPHNHAQNMSLLLGKMLRIHVSGEPTYTIPASNPFSQTLGARHEIWSLGLRNPWRFSFDRSTHGLYIGDVGDSSWEEIDYRPASSAGGENYGWHCYEGTHVYTAGACTLVGSVFPVAEYDHSDNNDAIMGGYVYRGSNSPALDGYYVFADNGSGNFFEMNISTHQLFSLGSLMTYPTSFGENAAGELFVTSISEGTVERVLGPQPVLNHHLFLPSVWRH
jgi:glucose/arabinose dehydrogenase